MSVNSSSSSSSSPPPLPRVFHRLQLPPVPERLALFTLYETKARFYLVGSNLAQTAFRVLKFDRLCLETTVGEDPCIYDKPSLTNMLAMIEAGNGGTLTKTVSEAYGVLGLIRFLHGYYLCLITKIKRVGAIGGHIIYTIEDTTLVSITQPSVFDSSLPHKANRKKLLSQEIKYKTLFSVMDLTKNFYFSYTYDLTNTLQTNMLYAQPTTTATATTTATTTSTTTSATTTTTTTQTAPVRDMFVWNWYLITAFRSLLVSVTADQWLVQCIHGFFEQSNCSVFSHLISLTLISRRSRLFAGTRYLKRGLNDKGQVANEVETEQILHNREGGSYKDGNFTSHVQLRASIPLFWSQESNAMIARPAIVITKIDPVVIGPRLHMEDLFLRYGSPLLVLNLVRQNERKERESIIGSAFGDIIKFLNVFLPIEHQIDYYAWDFKQVSKSKTLSVVDELVVIAHWALQRTGVFHSHPRGDARTYVGGVNVKPTKSSIEDLLKLNENQNICFLQQGIMRSNCIDSLDRTNVAQFCVGKCALGYQLYAMGIIESCQTESSSEMVNILLDMYEHNGDCLAMQYGGSQMHRQMKKDRNKSVTMAPVLYRQKAPNKPKEMFVSLMRHYQNSFQDTSKQDAINVFLGNFQPSLKEDAIQIWDLSSDYYLHNSPIDESLDTHGQILYENPKWFLDPIRKYEKLLTFIPSNNNSNNNENKSSSSNSSNMCTALIPSSSSSSSSSSASSSFSSSSSSKTPVLSSPNSERKISETIKENKRFLPQTNSKDLRFRELYLSSNITFFDEIHNDDLLRVKCIRISGVKSEMRKTFTQRLRNTLPTKTKQEAPSAQNHEEASEFDGDRMGLEVGEAKTGQWQLLAAPSHITPPDLPLARLLEPYIHFSMEADLMVPPFGSYLLTPYAASGPITPSPVHMSTPSTPAHRRRVSTTVDDAVGFMVDKSFKSSSLTSRRDSVGDSPSEAPSRRISLESPRIVAPTRRIIMINTLPASPEAGEEDLARERASSEGWLAGSRHSIGLHEEDQKPPDQPGFEPLQHTPAERYLSQICTPPDHSALENYWRGSPELYSQYAHLATPEALLKSTFLNPNVDFWTPSPIQLNESQKGYYESYLAP